jgi:hypothetical protein
MVIVIEHNQAVMAHAGWIIDLGPGAGHEGGRTVFEGAHLVAARSTLTGEHLVAYVGADHTESWNPARPACRDSEFGSWQGAGLKCAPISCDLLHPAEAAPVT